MIPAGVAAPAPIVPAVAVGVAPNLIGAGGAHAIFPTDRTYVLSHAEIVTLMHFYNETFGILPADAIDVRRDKVRLWLTL